MNGTFKLKVKVDTGANAKSFLQLQRSSRYTITKWKMRIDKVLPYKKQNYSVSILWSTVKTTWYTPYNM